MRFWLKRLHLTLALIAGLFLISVSLSASLLVFGKDIQQILQSTHWEIIPPPQPPDFTQALNDLMAQVASESADIAQLNISDRPDWPWVVSLTSGEQWNLNPTSGRIIHRYHPHEDFYHLCMRWHRWLWIEDKTLKPWARHIISGATLLLIIEIILGFIMWSMPRRGMLKRLKLRPARTWRARLHQYHLLTGVLLGIPLIIIAFTGISFNWPTQKIFETATFSSMQARENNHAVSTGGLEKLSLAIHNARKTLPEASIRRIYFPQKNDTPLLIRMQHPNEKAPFSYLWMDGGTGQLLTLYNSATAPPANQWWDFKYAFHTGTWFGKATQWLWLLMALLPALFSLSGLYLYCKRRAPTQRKA